MENYLLFFLDSLKLKKVVFCLFYICFIFKNNNNNHNTVTNYWKIQHLILIDVFLFVFCYFITKNGFAGVVLIQAGFWRGTFLHLMLFWDAVFIFHNLCLFLIDLYLL